MIAGGLRGTEMERQEAEVIYDAISAVFAGLDSAVHPPPRRRGLHRPTTRLT